MWNIDGLFSSLRGPSLHEVSSPHRAEAHSCCIRYVLQGLIINHNKDCLLLALLLFLLCYCFPGCKVEMFYLNVEAVNTHRDRPLVSPLSRHSVLWLFAFAAVDLKPRPPSVCWLLVEWWVDGSPLAESAVFDNGPLSHLPWPPLSLLLRAFCCAALTAVRSVP